MKLLTNQVFLDTIKNQLNIDCSKQEQILLKDYKICTTPGMQIYVEKTNDTSQNAIIVDVSEEDFWKIDKFQHPIFFEKKQIELSNDENTYAYFLVESNLNYAPTIQAVNNAVEQETLQLANCDILLLLPGCVTNKQKWDSFKSQDNYLFNHFKKKIEFQIKSEYDNDFASDFDRKCLGVINISINDGKFNQPALLCTVMHQTEIAALEILIPNCVIGGNKLLTYFCGEEIKIEFNGITYKPDELTDSLGMERYGSQRSMVFNYASETTKEEIYNALANEEYPMGKIKDSYAERINAHNIALYDIAEVYVSPTTMLECCKPDKDKEFYNVLSRVTYQVIELFFVELLLFQDASTDKVYRDLQKEQEIQLNIHTSNVKYSINDAVERYEQISFEMAQSMQFTDYDHFYYPTTRLSAKTIAETFGLNLIYEKNRKNQNLLELMMQSNERREQEHQNSVKNKFLLIITICTFVQALGEIINSSVKMPNWIGYFISLAIAIIGFVLYLLIVKNKKRGKKNGKEKN